MGRLKPQELRIELIRLLGRRGRPQSAEALCDAVNQANRSLLSKTRYSAVWNCLRNDSAFADDGRGAWFLSSEGAFVYGRLEGQSVEAPQHPGIDASSSGETPSQQSETAAPSITLASPTSSFVFQAPLAMLAMHLSPRQRSHALNGLSDITIATASDFLVGALDHEPLRQVFDTDRRRLELSTSIAMHVTATLAHCQACERNPRLTWVVPDALLAAGCRTRRQRVQEAAQQVSGSRAGLPELPSDNSCAWITRVSVESARALRKVHEGRRAWLLSSTGKLCLRLGSTHPSMPWDASLPSGAGYLPIEALYQFKPDAPTHALLQGLSTSGCSSIGHLEALHPALWTFIRQESPSFWVSLATKLAQ